MSDECPRQHCFAPGTGCALGHVALGNCPEWQGSAASGADSAPSTDETLLPWTGNAMGLVDLGFVTGRGKPIVVGIVGSQNAGKTTLLAAWYLLLGRGTRLNSNWRIAGSYTLQGWETVAGVMRWEPGQPPSFPAHTTSRSARSPGLLHLAFRKTDGGFQDFLLTDAPGEWFHRWAVNREAPEAEGARWVAEHADVFLMIADREALSGRTVGPARSALQLLARRLGAERGTRRVALVWSKADIVPTAEAETAVRDAVNNAIPGADEFKVSILSDGEEEQGQGILQLLNWLLTATRNLGVFPPASASEADPFLMIGSLK